VYNKIRILGLKNRAKKAYEEYHRILDRYSCGASLAEAFNVDLVKAKIKFNKAWEKLASIDPKCPNKEFRL
jgi:hypothetical protein